MVATSEDVPGWQQKLRPSSFNAETQDMIPELVLLNGVLPAGSGAVTFQLTNRQELIEVAS